MTEQTTLFLGPEEDIAILKGIFSSRKNSVENIAKVTGKNRGTIHNAVHDLRILCLIDENLNPLAESKNIVYNRNAEEVLKGLFTMVSGHKKAIEEINLKERIDPLEAGKIFCFHTNARATKDSSIKQIGRRYLRWIKYLNLLKNKQEKKENDSER